MLAQKIMLVIIGRFSYSDNEYILGMQRAKKSFDG